jgi:hypothetical protein
MAMSCLAFPVLGRPTRRARLSSSSVDCGISEKSMRRSEIRLALFTTGLARVDDADCFFAMFDIPHGIDNYQDAALRRGSQPFTAQLSIRVFRISPIESVWVAEYCLSLFERDSVFRKVRNSFRRVPREHIIVYTLIESQNQDLGSLRHQGAVLIPAATNAATSRPEARRLQARKRREILHPLRGFRMTARGVKAGFANGKAAARHTATRQSGDWRSHVATVHRRRRWLRRERRWLWTLRLRSVGRPNWIW